MTTAIQLLSSVRLSRIVRAVQDIRLLPGRLPFSQRTPESLSWDGEIIARDIARVLIADIIADDSEAGTYSTGKLTTESFAIPNIKVGIQFTQSQINQLVSLGLMGGVTGSVDPGSLYEGSGLGMVNTIMRDRARRIALGIAQRKEALIIAMQLDSLTYNRMGVQISTTWGTPADLKTALTGNRTWDNPTTAKPVEDILYKKLYARIRYGENYNRVTMTTTDFIYATATDDFQNRARAILVRYGASPAPLPTQDLGQMQTLFENLTQCSLELNDETYWQQNEDGTVTNYFFFPQGTVLFSDRNDDGNPAVMDVADSYVTETIVGQLVGQSGGLLGNIGSPARGPVAYATGSLNPPLVTLWGVKRCMPRKFRLTATATLDVGTSALGPSIPVGEPY